MGRCRPPEEQQAVLDRLQEARDEVKKAGDKIEEELHREQMLRAADSLRRLKDRQAALVAEGERLQKVVIDAGEWRFEIKNGLLQLADVQGRKKEDVKEKEDNVPGLGDETAALAKRDLAGAPVLARMVRRSAEAMGNASDRLRNLAEHTAAAGLPARRSRCGCRRSAQDDWSRFSPRWRMKSRRRATPTDTQAKKDGSDPWRGWQAVAAATPAAAFRLIAQLKLTAQPAAGSESEVGRVRKTAPRYEKTDRSGNQ